MKLALLLLCSACTTQDDAVSSKVTLDDQTWTASAVSFDVLGPAAVRVVLAHELDRAECSWTAFDQVEISLLIGDRTTPHALTTLDVTTPNSGGVDYTDEQQNIHRAVAGTVRPGRTTWAYSAAEDHNVIVQLDGEFHVTLDDGRVLAGAFSAAPCGGSE